MHTLRADQLAPTIRPYRHQVERPERPALWRTAKRIELGRDLVVLFLCRGGKQVTFYLRHFAFVCFSPDPHDWLARGDL